MISSANIISMSSAVVGVIGGAAIDEGLRICERNKKYFYNNVFSD